MQISFSVWGTGRRSGEHIVSLVTDILWHCGASPPLKGFAHIVPPKENSRRKQVEHITKKPCRFPIRKPVETDESASVSPKRVPSTMDGHTRCSDTCGDECCELKTYRFYMLLVSGA